MKRALVALFIFSTVVIGGGLLVSQRYQAPGDRSFVGKSAEFPTPSPTPSAMILIERGAVEVKEQSAWNPAVDGATVNQGAGVRTKKDAAASLVFPGLGVMKLDAETEVTVELIGQSRVGILQTIGSTYSTVRKLLGVGESYEVETPTSVATVRGTAFGVVVGSDQSSNIAVGEDTVVVSAVKIEGGKKKRLEEVTMTKDQAVAIDKHTVEELEKGRGKLAIGEARQLLPEDRRQWFEENRKRQEEFRKMIDEQRPREFPHVLKQATESGEIPQKSERLNEAFRKPELFLKMKAELGCDSPDSCQIVCQEPGRWEMCRSILSRYGMNLPSGSFPMPSGPFRDVVTPFFSPPPPITPIAPFEFPPLTPFPTPVPTSPAN